MPVNLYYTQKVRGFQQEKVKYSKESVEIHLKRTKHQYPCCGSSLRKAWILRLLPCQGDKAVCGWQAERFQFPAKNPCRIFEQKAESGTVSKL